MKKKLALLRAVLAAVLVLSFPIHAYCQTEDQYKGRQSVQLGHLYTIIDCSLSLLAEGSNMVLLAGMKMFPTIDPLTLEHGRNMIATGKDLIQRASSGPDMKKNTEKPDPSAGHLRKLTEAALNYATLVEKLSKTPAESAPDPVRRGEIIINHSVAMAVEASNLTLAGKEAIAKELDNVAVERGEVMTRDAHIFAGGILNSREIQELKAGKLNAGQSYISDLSDLGQAALKILDLLEKRPELSSSGK